MVLPFDEAEAFEFRDLPADRGVIAPDPVGEVDDPDRAAPLNDDKQRKQRPVERYPGLPHHRFVPLRAVHYAHNVDQCLVQGTERLTIMCILHIFS
jgi:hypothetical protein